MKHVPALPYSIGISSIPRNIHPYSGGRVWAEPTESFPAADACLACKKFKKMYKIYRIGNTIIRKEIRQHKSNEIRQQISTYLIAYRERLFPHRHKIFYSLLTQAANTAVSKFTGLVFLYFQEGFPTREVDSPENLYLYLPYVPVSRITDIRNTHMVLNCLLLLSRQYCK